MTSLICPHGGTLIQRMLSPDEAGALKERILGLNMPVIELDLWALRDASLLATGVFSPLKGFMSREDYESVVQDMRLADGTIWPVPITLPVSQWQAMDISRSGEVGLAAPGGRLVGLMRVVDIYTPDRGLESDQVYGTRDEKHPGVGSLLNRGRVYVAGPVLMMERAREAEVAGYTLSPEETRAQFRRRHWRRVVAFQTRNPIHRAHEYVQKVALEMVDGLFLSPVVGSPREGEVGVDVRLETYLVMLETYLPSDRVILGFYPANMRFAGPREAVLHAIARQNYGCTHFIVGRDHAGTGSYYGPYDAQRIFDRFQPGELGIQPLFFDHAFYCRRCGGMASTRTCPHPHCDHVSVSGTEMRNMLRAGERPPAEVTRPEVADVLTKAYRPG